MGKSVCVIVRKNKGRRVGAPWTVFGIGAVGIGATGIIEKGEG